MKKNLAGVDGDAESSEVLYISSKGKAKKTLHKGKSHFNVEHYRAVFLMFDTLRTPGHIVSVMMLTVELKRIPGAPVSLHVLSQCVTLWLVSVGIVQHCVTHVAQNTRHCETAMQDFTMPSVLCNMSDTVLNNSNTDKPVSNMLTQNMQ